MIAVDRAVWTIHNKNFQVILDGEIKESKVSDKKFSPGGDIWTGEISVIHYLIKSLLMQKLVKNQNMVQIY